MAIENARDVYTRRMEGISIWVVESKYVHASNPDDAGEIFMSLPRTKYIVIQRFMICQMK